MASHLKNHKLKVRRKKNLKKKQINRAPKAAWSLANQRYSYLEKIEINQRSSIQILKIILRSNKKKKNQQHALLLLYFLLQKDFRLRFQK